MGRPEEPLERDGSPATEFAWWLRDLRRRSGLTYQSLAQNTHYATSTVAAAANGRQLPSLKVLLAIVRACGGDETDWREYWSMVMRAADAAGPGGSGPAPEPPWVTRQRAAETASQPVAVTAAPGDWYVESFDALLLADRPRPEAVEHRVIVAVTAGVTELETSISVPRHPGDEAEAHGVEAELEYGGSLGIPDQLSESHFQHVITLPAPLEPGGRHEYQMRLRVPPGQPMAPHYAYVPDRRSDRFRLRVRFGADRVPAAIYLLDGSPAAALYERDGTQELLTPDRFGEVALEFRKLRIGRAYGIRWQDAPPASQVSP